jgi:putative flippase GtrA
MNGAKISRLGQLGRLARASEAGRFLLFLAVGGLNTLVGYVFFLALHALGLPPTPAVVGATILGVAFNYLSTGRIVFASGGVNRLPRFLAVYAVQCAANLLMLHALLALGLSVLFAEAIVMAVLAVATYVAMKKFVFADLPPRGRTAY